MMFLPVFKGASPNAVLRNRQSTPTLYRISMFHTWERIYDKHERFFDCFTFVVLKIGDFPLKG